MALPDCFSVAGLAAVVSLLFWPARPSGSVEDDTPEGIPADVPIVVSVKGGLWLFSSVGLSALAEGGKPEAQLAALASAGWSRSWAGWLDEIDSAFSFAPALKEKMAYLVRTAKAYAFGLLLILQDRALMEGFEVN